VVDRFTCSPATLGSASVALKTHALFISVAAWPYEATNSKIEVQISSFTVVPTMTGSAGIEPHQTLPGNLKNCLRVRVISLMETALRVRIAKLAEQAHLPTIFFNRESVVAGGLLGYGPDIVENYRRAAIFVDKSLKEPSPQIYRSNDPTRLN